jgi:hypothetical protein
MHDDAETFAINVTRFGRAVIIAALYYIGFMIFGVSQSKAWMACSVLVLMQMLSLGTFRIRQIGIAFILLAGFYWIDILPLQQLSQIAAAKIGDAILALNAEH